MKVVVVHDYITQRGGAERVVLELLRIFPGARLVTSVFEPSTTYPEFAQYDIETLWLNRFSFFRRDPRRAFPFLATAFRRHVVRDADIVIASSSGWAHRVHTDAPKVVYCHNPARWLYQPHDYLHRLSPRIRHMFVSLTQKLRHTDALAATTAEAYMVNSTSVASRVHDVYGISPAVVAPARGLSPDGPQDKVSGVQPGFLLTVGRGRAYKHTEAICEAVSSMPDERLVVVGGRAHAAHDGVKFLPRVSDAELRWLYAHSAGLVAVSHEDFGLTPVEAQGFGVPSVVLRSGGYLDSTREGITGVFVDEPTPNAVVGGIRALRIGDWSGDDIRAHGEHYSPDSFQRRVHAVVDHVVTGGGSRRQGAA